LGVDGREGELFRDELIVSKRQLTAMLTGMLGTPMSLGYAVESFKNMESSIKFFGSRAHRVGHVESGAAASRIPNVSFKEVRGTGTYP
jgi:hypothetical protein